jgi:tetratricopeptide (TPR) repeat protein
VKPGRNEHCPCGSGKKYKKCCGNGQSAAPAAEGAQSWPPVDLNELLTLIHTGRYGDLETKSRELIEQHPDSGLAWKALGISLTMQGKDALHALKRATELLPDDPEAHSNLGNAWLSLGRLVDAEASYGRALAIKPDFAEAHSNLANALQSQGRLDEAVASYARALEIRPHYPEACNNLGNALRGLGRFDEALASYRRALAIKPDFAEAHSNLGNTLRSLGRLEEALASYQRALDIRPHYSEACNNLGNALLDLRRFEAAAASYRTALQIKPDFVEAHSNLGNALRGLGRLDEAAASYAQALALDPDFAGAHSNLGDVLRDLGRPAEAAASCRRAIALQPDLAGAHNSLGNALLDLGQLDPAAASYGRALTLRRNFAEGYINLGLLLRQRGSTAEAEAHCRTALEMNPDAAPAIVLQAELQADNGRFAEAEELFRRAVAIDPELPEAWAGIAHLRKMTPSDTAWAAQAQRIAGQRLAPRREVYLRFAIGKYFDDVKDFSQAFANYRRAHELKKLYGAPHDRQQLTRAVDQMILTYDEAWASRVGMGAAASTRPVFILGMPRSGTTLAEQILASHPAVFGAGELPFWERAASMHQSSAWNTEASGRSSEAGDNITAELAAEYLQLLEELSPDALRVVDKMPANFLCLGLIHEALPNARIIHMQRNPLDTCLSIYFQHFKTGHSYADDLGDLAHYYAEYLRLMEHWKSVLPEAAILDVPYENLVEDQEAWSRKMLQFIDVPWDPRCLDFHQTNRSVMTASKWQVRQKINRSSVERWRNYEEFLGSLLTLAKPEQVGRHWPVPQP